MSADPIDRLNAALGDRYRIERELGAGGMATVYLADDLRLERKVALKVLRPELAAVVGAERFLAEIKTTANLQHPHILPLFDSGEAAADREPTAASDVYSLGCVLFEMLVGEPPFTGGSAQAVLARILTGSPPSPSGGRPSIPPHVDAAIRRALERLPADRFGSAEGLASALRERSFRHGTAPDEAQVAGAPWRAVALVTSGIAIAAAVLAGWALSSRALPVRDLGLPYDRPVHMGFYRNFSVSPDASFLLYEAQTGSTTELWRLDLATGAVQPIEGTEGAYGTPRISPDGERVAFAANRTLRVPPIGGGGATVVADVADPLGGGWLDDGRIFFADEDGRIVRWVDPETGPVGEVPVDYCILPGLLPDGESVLCGGGGEKHAFVRPLADARVYRNVRRQAKPSSPSTAILPGSDFRVVDGEYLLYMSLDGDLLGARLAHPDSLRVSRP